MVPDEPVDKVFVYTIRPTPTHAARGNYISSENNIAERSPLLTDVEEAIDGIFIDGKYGDRDQGMCPLPHLDIGVKQRSHATAQHEGMIRRSLYRDPLALCIGCRVL